MRKFLKVLVRRRTLHDHKQKIYDDDLKKIGFVISFMTERQATAWADQFVEEATKIANTNH
jgi:hypothetical protein